MQMENFRKGDFIRLKDLDKWQVNRISGKTINIFEINNIKPEYIEVKNCKEKIPISEVEPIPINGIADFRIYYDPIIAASCIKDGEPIPIRQVDRSYYLEAFKKHTYKGKNFNDLVKEQNLEYVNDVQNFLRREFKKSELRIDAI
jgi:hypothetical protein